MAFVKTAAGREACLNGGWIQALAGGSLGLYAADDTTLLCTFTYASPAFTTNGSGVATIAGAITATPGANGTAAYYHQRKSDGTDLGRGTVAASGADLNITNIVLSTAVPITLPASFTHTEPAS
jgi:hypothetical protein